MSFRPVIIIMQEEIVENLSFPLLSQYMARSAKFFLLHILSRCVMLLSVTKRNT